MGLEVVEVQPFTWTRYRYRYSVWQFRTVPRHKSQPLNSQFSILSLAHDQSARCTNTNTNGPTPPTTPHHINPPCPCTLALILDLNTRSQFICIQFDTLTLEEQRDRFHMSLACHDSYGYGWCFVKVMLSEVFVNVFFVR